MDRCLSDLFSDDDDGAYPRCTEMKLKLEKEKVLAARDCHLPSTYSTCLIGVNCTALSVSK